MGIAQRIELTIEEWQAKWKDRLRGWSLRVIAEGITKLFEGLEEEAEPSAREFIDTFPMHPEVKAQLETFIIKRSPIHLPAFAVMAIGVILGSLIGTFMGWATPISKWTSYVGEKIIKSARLDPGSIITAWRRNKPKYEKYFQDLKDQGWDDDRIEALKFFTLYYPSPAELVHWTAREVFEPDKVSKYGLMTDADKLRREDFYKAGIDDAQINNHWIAHWEHASWIQVIEMLHRGIITEQDVKDWFPLVEIAPYWAENLIKIAYTWPTRVDVRRFWDMRTIDETRLRKLYEGMGYRSENLEDYIKWTKVYTDFPMMIARFTKGWITEKEIYDWLIAQGIPAERARHFIEEKIKPEKPAQVEEDRLATATEIMKGVKKGVIRWNEGIEMLGDLRYSPEVAEFKLTVYLGIASGSPETYSEFKKMTQLYRKSLGQPAKIPSEELIQAEKDVKEAKRLLDTAIEEKAMEATLMTLRKAISDNEYRYRQLLIQHKEKES